MKKMQTPATSRSESHADPAILVMRCPGKLNKRTMMIDDTTVFIVLIVLNDKTN